MKNNKYKILVLSDIKNSLNSTVMSAISLAKIFEAEIDFFYVKKPIEVLKNDNQLSAMRKMSKDHFDTEKQIKELLNPFSRNYNQKINSSFSFGNVKSELLDCINKSKPDIIVLGKRKSAGLKLMGDNITDFVLKKYKGSLFIAADENGLEPEKQLSLGFLDGIDESFKKDFTNDLINHSKKPLKAFKIGTQKSPDEDIVSNKEFVEYVFEKNDNTATNLSNYLQKNNINLFCVNRDMDDSIAVKKTNTQFKELISKLNVSVLLSNNQYLSID
jgi:hypothetical protein